jgi:hypothetical protein
VPTLELIIFIQSLLLLSHINTSSSPHIRYNTGPFVPKLEKWTAETHAYFMGLVEERKGENGTVTAAAWKQIAQLMSAKEWTSSGGGTHKLSYTWRACKERYGRYKDTAFEESGGVRVIWTEAMLSLLMKLTGEWMGENGKVSEVAWKSIALAMSAKEWETSESGTYKVSFTWSACQQRYSNYKGAYTKAYNMHSIPTTFSH